MSAFTYTTEQEKKIRHALQAHGFADRRMWPRLLSDITDSVRYALRVEEATEASPLPPASEAEGELQKLGSGITRALSAWERMSPTLQEALDSHLPSTIGPFMRSITPIERLAVERILTAPRLALLMEALRRAAEMARGPLSSKIAPVSEEAMRLLPPQVQEAVRTTSQRKPSWRGLKLVAYKGEAREDGVRRVVPTLYRVFEQATGKQNQPTVFKNSHKDRRDGKPGQVGYDGTFYEFAMAALLPTRLAPKDKLPSRIYTAYNEHRRAVRKSKKTNMSSL